MPKGFDSISRSYGKVTVTLDYSFHRWHEPEGSYLEWDTRGLYINDKPATEAEIKRVDPKWFGRFDSLIRDRH
jgi:hypothetical protein